MAKRYEVFRKGNDPGQDYVSYKTAVLELVDRLPEGKAYLWKRRGQDDWRKARSKWTLRLKLLTLSLQVGDAFYAKREGGTATYVLRAIEVLTVPVYPDPAGTPGIKSLWDATWVAFKNLGPGYELVWMGGFVCRRIDGSMTWSQHAFHNAFDFRIRKSSAGSASIDVEATTKVVNQVKDQAAETLWQTAGHTYHAHLTGAPKRIGTPACA